MKNYVIIGNGIATAGCIEGIRSVDSLSKITVVSEEKHPVYCRPLISYYLEGKTTLAKMDYRDSDYYEKMGCDVVYGVRADKIDSLSKNVILSDGKVLKYDSLCVATGSTPFLPKFEGIEKVEKRFSFMTLDDALALEKAITPESKVLIVGAGLIGLKCAEGLINRVKKITVCDLAGRILSSIFDDDAAEIMQKHIEKKGIEFLLSDTVNSFESNKAYMKSGKTVEFDVLVTAVGVRANTALVSEAGGEVNRGIIVDSSMKTSLPDIYATGDCTEGDDYSFGKKRVLALLPNAYMQGKCAGVNMAGGKAVFDNAIPMNSIGFFGLHAMTAGSYFTEEEGCRIDVFKGENEIRKFFVKDDTLCGYFLIGKVDRGGIYTDMVRKKTPLSSLDFDLVETNPTFSAFSRDDRKTKFGGVK